MDSDVSTVRHDESIQTAAPKTKQEGALEKHLILIREAARKLGGLAGECSMMAVRIEYPTDRHWRICLSRNGTMALNYFQTGENGRKLAQSISSRIGRDLHFEFVLTQEPPHDVAKEALTIEPQPTLPSPKPSIPHSQLIRNAMVHPLIKQFMDIFEAQVVRVDPAQTPIPSLHLDTQKPIVPESEDKSLREKLRMDVRFESAFDE